MPSANKRIQFLLQTRKNGGKPSNYPTNGVGVPLRITRLFPMKLKDITIKDLEEKQTRTSDVVCLTEMMSLFDCFERNEFDRSPCQQHVQALQKCHSGFIDEKRSTLEKRKELREKQRQS